MVKFNLPQNSKIKVGKYYKNETDSKNLRKINIYRWDPSTEENPRVDTYEVDMDNCPSKVLDILNKISKTFGPQLSMSTSKVSTLGFSPLDGSHL